MLDAEYFSTVWPEFKDTSMEMPEALQGLLHSESQVVANHFAWQVEAHFVKNHTLTEHSATVCAILIQFLPETNAHGIPAVLDLLAQFGAASSPDNPHPAQFDTLVFREFQRGATLYFEALRRLSPGTGFTAIDLVETSVAGDPTLAKRARYSIEYALRSDIALRTPGVLAALERITSLCS